MLNIHTRRSGSVGLLTMSRPPHNFFDAGFLTELADAVDRLDADQDVQATVLASDQRSFCAGADFGGGSRPDPKPIYEQAKRLMRRRKPMIAAVRGAAVGGGLGLALVADMRVGEHGTRFEANFVRIGISAGFGLSFTLPRVVGAQKARDMLLTGRRVGGEEALSLGLLDRLADAQDTDKAALRLAQEMAAAAPSAVQATRRLIGPGDQLLYEAAIDQELAEQLPLFQSPNFAEGVAATRERRSPNFASPHEELA